MLAQLKRRYRIARLAYRFVIRDELKSPTPVPLPQRIGLVRRGYLSHAHELYNLSDYALGEYLSDMASARMTMMYDGRDGMAGYQYGLNNKIFLTAIVGQHARLPVVYGFIERGRVFAVHDKADNMFVGSWLEACRAAGGSLVIKPNAGARGIGVFFLAAADGKLLLNGTPATEQAVHKKISGLDEYIIGEFLHQGDYAAQLYPETTNTMRIVTMMDPATNEPFMPVAVQRIGRVASQPVDNWSRGGLSAEIDLDTGVLSRVATRETEKRTLVWHEKHPDTSAPIQGVIVPQWNEIKRALLKIASRMPYYKSLSWDILSMDEGLAVIEVDTVMDVESIQVHRPLLRDMRVRKVLRYHGVV